MMPELQTEEWLVQVDGYLDRLETTTDRLQDQLAELGRNTGNVKTNLHQQLTTEVAESVQELQSLLEGRRELLADFAADDPRRVSLREALRRSQQPQRYERAQQLADQIEEVRLAALTLFVVQFQMFETSKQILRCILKPETDPGGYGHRTVSTGGGLLDEAA